MSANLLLICPMSDQRLRLEQAVAALEGQRQTLGDDLLAIALAPLRQRLAAIGHASAGQQLRLVTVLFTDIVGSTALSQHLDPEEVGAVMDGALARFTEIVQQYQGRVLQYAGDSLLAVFGTPTAHENDAERAVLAGLAILDQGRKVAADVLARHGRDGFDLRVGAHTGSVLLGGGVDGDDSIRGMMVNIAARMEQSAPAGNMRISQDSYRQVRGLFDLLEQPPLHVKGQDEPMRTYLVQGVRIGSVRTGERGVDGVQARLVGREAEFAALRAALAQLSQPTPTAPRCLTVVGEAGLGKSRLMAELRSDSAALPGAPRWLAGRGAELDLSRPYQVLRSMLCAELGLHDSLPAATASQAWLTAVAPWLGSPDDAAVLGHLLGFDFSSHAEVRALSDQVRQLRDRAFFHACQLLAAWVDRHSALVLWVDDLHWVDDGSLDFIEHLLAGPTPLRLLLLAQTRPTFYERRPHWDETATGQSRLDLQALTPKAAAELADALLGQLGDVPASLRNLITDNAEGNPFYMEELVNVLLDQDVIRVESGRWHYQPARLGALRVPATLVGVLRARLDALSIDEYRTAQLAAVVGFRFWDDSLFALGAPLPDGLRGLVDRELVVPVDPSSLDGLREYTFKHHTLHQVTYDSLLKPFKRTTHGQVAHWLLAQPGGIAFDLVADHSERGGETAMALDLWQRAADDAASRYANAQALAHADRALALTAPDDLARRYALTCLRCEVLALISELDKLTIELDILRQLATRSGDADKLADALFRAARNCYHQGEVAQAMTLAEHAMTVAPEGAPDARLLRGECLARLGRHAEAKTEFARAMNLADTRGDKVRRGKILNDLAMLALDQGDPGAARLLYEQALSAHCEIGNRVNEGVTLSNLGYVALVLGDYASACGQFTQARSLFARVGHRQNEAITLVNLGIAYLNQARPGEALDHATQASAMLRTHRDRWAQGAALRVMGQAALALADTAAARQHFEASRRLFDDMQMPHLAIEAMAGLAETAIARDDGADALAQVEEILARLAAGVSLDGSEEPMRVHLVCHQVLAATQDPRAEQILRRAYDEISLRAQRISDAALRNSFIAEVPHHRALVAAWAALADGGQVM